MSDLLKGSEGGLQEQTRATESEANSSLRIAEAEGKVGGPGAFKQGQIRYAVAQHASNVMKWIEGADLQGRTAEIPEAAGFIDNYSASPAYPSSGVAMGWAGFRQGGRAASVCPR